MGILITPIHVPSRIESPEGNFFFLCGEDFSGFFPEPFPGAITTAAAVIITAIITVIITTTIIATVTLIIIIITATATGGTPIKVKAFSFIETF